MTSAPCVLTVALADPALWPRVNTFLSLAERVRQKVMTQFNDTGLYYHLTEILCRKPRVYESTEQCVETGCLPFQARKCPTMCFGAAACCLLLTCTSHAPTDRAINDTNVNCMAMCDKEVRDECAKICTADDWISHPIHADANPFDCDLLVRACVYHHATTHILTHPHHIGRRLVCAPPAAGLHRAHVSQQRVRGR